MKLFIHQSLRLSKIFLRPTFHLPVDAADFLTVLCRYTSAAQENNFSRLKLHVRLVSLTMKMFRNYRIPFLVKNWLLTHI